MEHDLHSSNPTPLPGVPGLGRNAFVGPNYPDLDLALTKAFGLPSMKVLGEGARIEIRANAFNFFNKVNLANIDANIPDLELRACRRTHLVRAPSKANSTLSSNSGLSILSPFLGAGRFFKL